MKHSLIPGPAGPLHVVERGEGPLVLLVHGFPESWYSWRHQLAALAEAGFRAAAIDVRGYGRSCKPRAVEAYRMLAHVADNVAILNGLGAKHAAIVGHDWGSPIAATSALLRPDLFSAVGLLGVPYSPRGATRPSEAFALAGGEEEFYVSYFQRPAAEAEIEVDVRSWLAAFYAALSGDTEADPAAAGVFTIPAGGRMRDRLPVPHRLPAWLSESDLDVYSGELERSGLTGPLNRYRNVDRDWEDLAAWDGAVIRQPSIFIAGERDATTIWLGEAITAHADTLPGLTGSYILPGRGHWIQQEAAEEVSALLVRWLSSVDS